MKIDNKKVIVETISTESDLVSKLKALTEVEIFDFMQTLRGGTYFNMGMYSFIPVSRAYKKTLRIYKVVNMTAIVSGVSYENIGTTKDFRNQTGETAGRAWYDHMSGFENKVGVKKSDPNSKYVLWDIKAGSDSWVRYYVVDIATGTVTPISKSDILASSYLTDSEKAKLMPKKVTGFDLTTGAVVENQTNWRTAAFEHIFWLSQAGKTNKEYGMKFTEGLKDMKDNKIVEAFGDELFMDRHANVKTNLDSILSGAVDEDYQKALTEETESTKSIKGVRTITLHNDIGEKVVLEFNTFEEAAKHFEVVYINAVEENYAEEVLYPILTQAQDEDYDYIDDEGYAVIEVDATGIFDSYNDIDENCMTPNKTNNLEEPYRRTVSRGNTLVDNELFVDFDDQPLEEADVRKAVSAADLASLSLPYSNYVIAHDDVFYAVEGEQFVNYDSYYNEVGFDHCLDELNSESIFSTFVDAFSVAKTCAKLEEDHEFFIVGIDLDTEDCEVAARISCRQNGYHWFSLYDNATKTWSNEKKVR